MPDFKQRRRRGEALPPTAAIVVRGDLLDPDRLRHSACDNHEIYGFFGVSVFAEVGGTTWEAIAATKLATSSWVVLFTVGALLDVASISGTQGKRRTTTSFTRTSTS